MIVHKDKWVKQLQTVDEENDLVSIIIFLVDDCKKNIEKIRPKKSFFLNFKKIWKFYCRVFLKENTIAI